MNGRKRERRSKWPSRLGLGSRTFEGLALPAAGPKLITLKLANGCNVNYPESYVESVRNSR